MADIVQLDPTVDLTNITNTTPASSPGSSSFGSDSDAVNTASARVYFGPFQSPEKKLIHQITHPNVSRRGIMIPVGNESPPRRSARFPSPAINSRDDTEENGDNSDANDESDDGDEDLSQSRSGTPDNVRFPQDEPSSVLASRIIRAQDNPSPPPRARHMASFASSPLKDSSFPSIDHSASPDDDIPNDTDIGIKYSSMFDRPASPSPQPPNRLPGLPSLTLREASLSPPLAPSNTSQHELISFESFSTPAVSQGPQEFAVAEPSRQPQTGTTVNYLSPSPRRAMSPIRLQYDTDTLRPRSTSPTCRSPRLSPASDILSIDGQIPSPYERPSRPEPKSPPALPPMAAPVTQSDEPQPRTPRRSPRRSVTPQNPKPIPASPPPLVPSSPPGIATSSSFQPHFETPPAIGAVHQLAEPTSGAQTRKKRWKGKEKAGDEVVDESQEDRSRSSSAQREEKVDVIVEQLEDKEEKRRKRRQEKEDRMYRELGSLSPGSADVLAQLYPSIQATITPPGSPIKPEDDRVKDALSESITSIFPSQPNLFLASVQRPPPGSPVRFGSPFGGRSSPNKLIPTLGLDAPTRTPARRIPLREAIAQGTASAQKLEQMNNYLRPNESALAASLRSPVFSRPALDDPLRSPARRIPISEVMSSVKKDTRQGSRSPLRGVSRERSGSAEPRPQNKKEVSISIEQQRPMVLPTSSTSFRPVPKLPFPLVAPQSSGRDRPTSIPEGSETLLSPTVEMPPAHDKPELLPISSPAKSSLKQLSSSRIPRIGAKPYAKHTLSVKEKVNKLPTMARKAGATGSGTTKSSKSMRIVRSGSGSSSEDINIGPSNSARTKSVKDTPPSTNLKRKRGTEKTSPSHVRPVVLIRQVVPGMLGPKYAPATPPAVAKNLASNQVEVSPAKKQQRLITMRRVVDKQPENASRSRMEEEADVPDIIDEEAGETTKKRDKEEDDALIMLTKKSSRPAAKDSAPLPASPVFPEETSLPSQGAIDNALPNHHISGSLPLEDDTELSIKVRRTTRPRKQTPLNDIFTAPRPIQSRRKIPTSNRSDADGFSGLSSVALKALTSSNTARNQQNFVNLATEVIRKDGCRPESPMMKVRTISQREAEEKAKGRSERAHRRAQRSDDGMSDTDGFSSDRGDSSIVEEDLWDEDEAEEVRPYKHRRGPGDEEDYETPVKPERPLKRPRSSEKTEEYQEEIQGKKRVKWDRGLYSEIFLDEIEVKPKKRPKEDIIKKGCLAPTAKALRLDTLGNIINADLPLTDLVHENIVVKKFVYDNDVEPEVPVVKTTRSRSKKAKG